jgi:hypothetical protein
VDEAVPSLLQAIESAASEEDSVRALAGLQNIVAARGKEILPLLIPRLLQVPINSTSCKALKAVAKVTGSVMHYHLSSVLDVFVDSIADADASGAGDADAIGAALTGELGQTVATVVQSIDDVGVSFTIGEIVKYLSGANAAHRRIGAVLLNALISGSSANYSRQIPYMIKELLARFIDTDEKVVRASWDALLALVNKVKHCFRKHCVSHSTAIYLCAADTARRSCGPLGVCAKHLFNNGIRDKIPQRRYRRTGSVLHSWAKSSKRIGRRAPNLFARSYVWHSRAARTGSARDGRIAQYNSTRHLEGLLR